MDTASQTAAKTARAAMIDGPVGPQLMKLTLPVAGGILALMAYRLAEAWFVGHLGSQALAAVTFAFPVTMMVTSVSIGLGAGSSSVISRAIGAGEADVGRLVADALLLTAAVGLVCATAGLLLADPLARLLGADATLAPMVAGYFRIWFCCAVFFLVSSVGLSAARAAGDANFQGTAMIVSSAINLAAAPLTILGWGGGWAGFHGFGLNGAPIATAIAWVPLLGATFWRLRTLGVLSLDRPRAATFKSSTARILRVGAPAAGTNTVIPFASAVVTRLLSPFGHAAVAGFGLGTRVESMAMVAFFALSAVMNPFAGQNYGAGRLARIRTAMVVINWFCGTLGAALAIFLYAARTWIATRFTSDPATIQAACQYLTIVPISYGAAGVIAIGNAAFNGLNRPLSAVTVSVLRMLVVNVPVAWIGGHIWGVPGIYAGICVANLLVGTFCAAWVYRATGSK